MQTTALLMGCCRSKSVGVGLECAACRLYARSVSDIKAPLQLFGLLRCISVTQFLCLYIQWQIRVGPELAPVSYTHLTLPTIYSV